MRRTLVISGLVAAALTLAACGSDSSDDPDAAATVATDATDGSAPESTDVVEGTLVPATQPDESGKPAVSVPADLPTELVVTDLVDGQGRPAEDGDIVFVDYVGVRTEDGTEFDNSYKRGQAFALQLGTGGVIPGWDQGLIGAQAGGRRQLDIPTELAYGDNPPGGSVIQPGDALTFVIDVRAVVPKPDPADAPLDLAVEASVGADEVGVEDVVEGDGPVLEPGQTAIVHMLLIRGDTTDVLYDTWAQGNPFAVVFAEGQSLPGLIEGLDGMKVGGRRIVTMPSADAFGTDGNTELSLPGDTDLIAVVELIGAF